MSGADVHVLHGRDNEKLVVCQFVLVLDEAGYEDFIETWLVCDKGELQMNDLVNKVTKVRDQGRCTVDCPPGCTVVCPPLSGQAGRAHVSGRTVVCPPLQTHGCLSLVANARLSVPRDNGRQANGCLSAVIGAGARLLVPRYQHDPSYQAGFLPKLPSFMSDCMSLVIACRW